MDEILLFAVRIKKRKMIFNHEWMIVWGGEQIEMDWFEKGLFFYSNVHVKDDARKNRRKRKRYISIHMDTEKKRNNNPNVNSLKKHVFNVIYFRLYSLNMVRYAATPANPSKGKPHLFSTYTGTHTFFLC